MFNIKDFFAGVKTKVEAPKNNPVGRPKKRPKEVEALLGEEREEVEAAIKRLKKPDAAAVQDAIEDVFQDCLEEGEVEGQSDEHEVAEEDFQDAVQEPQVEDSAIVVKREPQVEKPQVHGVEASAIVAKGLELDIVQKGLKEEGFEVQIEDLKRLELKRQFSIAGLKGAEHGWKGGEYGRLGGRPRKKVEELQDGDRLNPSSNRKKQCAKGLRDETFNIIARLEIAELVKTLLPSFTQGGLEVGDVYTFLSDRTGRPKQKIKWAHENEDKWLEEKKRLHLGAGSKGTLRAHGEHGQVASFSTAKGLRAAGAGAKALFEGLYPSLRSFFSFERSSGRFVDVEDLLLEFEALLTGMQAKLEAKETDSFLSPFERRQLQELRRKMPRMQVPSTREYWGLRMKAVAGARLLKPQRMLSLTLHEEMCRVFETWKDWDWKLHMVCFGPMSWLEKQVCNATAFRKNLRNLVLSFSDQVPFWVLVKAAKQLYAWWELRSKGKKGDKNALENLLKAAGSWSQKVAADNLEDPFDIEVEDEGQQSEEDEQEEVEGAATAGMTQSRGLEAPGADRYRITIELEQQLHNWCNPELEPVASHAKALLVLIGTHGRLSNLDDEGRFIKTECFEFQGKPVVRRAGTSARGLLRSWVKLRRENEDVRRMLEKVEVMQQPAGFSDSIIAKWRIEQMCVENVGVLHSRDLCGSYLSETSRKASFLSHEICHWIAGKLSAVMQVTDTDVAFPFKAAARRSQANLRRELREKALEEKTPCILKCGPYEILRITYEAVCYIEQQNLEFEVLLKALRRNGYLAYRPDFANQKLVPVDENEPWVKDKPQGNHRMPAAWIEQRYSFLNDHGIPLEANWENCGAGVKKVEDMEDATSHGPLGCRVQLECCKETHPKGLLEPSVSLECGVDVDENDEDDIGGLLKLKELEHNRRRVAIDKHLTSQVPKQELSAKAAQRAKINQSLKILLPAWREEMRKKVGIECSRKQMLQALIPKAGETKKTEKLLSEAQKLTKVAQVDGLTIQSLSRFSRFGLPPLRPRCGRELFSTNHPGFINRL